MIFVNCKFHIDGLCSKGELGGAPPVEYCAKKCPIRLPIFGEITDSGIEKWTLAEKAELLARSLMSGQMKTLDSLTLRERWASCHAEPCPSRYLTKEGYHICLHCGCPSAKYARISAPGSTDAAPKPELGMKLTFNYVACPRRRAGFSNAETNK